MKTSFFAIHCLSHYIANRIPSAIADYYRSGVHHPLHTLERMLSTSYLVKAPSVEQAEERLVHARPKLLLAHIERDVCPTDPANWLDCTFRVHYQRDFVIVGNEKNVELVPPLLQLLDPVKSRNRFEWLPAVV
ncbi:MAG: hypothetical protein WC761_04090 [Candidatus Paceibacterota bacterium]|jgi:hypothetical protein